MPRRSHHNPAFGPAVLLVFFSRRARWVQAVVRRLFRWPRRVPVEVLTTERSRRVTLARELARALRQLQLILGELLPADLAIVVQHVIATDRQLAGCYQVGQRSTGTRFALIRLALQVDGRRLATDELLAALAEQCIGLATQLSSSSVIVPIDLNPAPASQIQRVLPLPVDPLSPSAQAASPRPQSAGAQRTA